MIYERIEKMNLVEGRFNKSRKKRQRKRGSRKKKKKGQDKSRR